MNPVNTKVPKELIELMSSQTLFDAIENIGNSIPLQLDQSGELYVIICEIITRKISSADFTKNVMRCLEVGADIAEKIRAETNRHIFDVIKSNMQSQSIQDDSATKTLERIGGFSVEKETPESGGEVTAADRSDILAGLENPPASVPSHTGTPPANLPTDTRSTTMPAAPASAPADNHTEPLVDYLLSNPAGRSTQKVSVPSPSAPTAGKPVSTTTSPAPKNDPYKEPL